MPLVRSFFEVQIQQVASREEVEALRHDNFLRHLLIIRICSEIQQLRQGRDRLNVDGRHLGAETPACQNMVRPLEAQVSLIPHLRGMLEVDRKIGYLAGRKFSTWIRQSAHLSTLLQVKRCVAQLQARCNESWNLSEAPQSARDERLLLSRAGGCKWKEKQPDSAATVGGRVCTDEKHLE